MEIAPAVATLPETAPIEAAETGPATSTGRAASPSASSSTPAAVAPSVPTEPSLIPAVTAASTPTPTPTAGTEPAPSAAPTATGAAASSGAASSGAPASRSILGAKRPLDREFSCPICLELIHEAFVTVCGHSFCYACISKHLDLGRESCPVCNGTVKRDQIFPNLMLDRFIERTHEVLESGSGSGPNPVALLSSDAVNLSAAEIDSLLKVLTERKRRLENSEREVELEVVAEFLQRARAQRFEMAMKLHREIDMLSDDLRQVEARRQALAGVVPPPPLTPTGAAQPTLPAASGAVDFSAVVGEPLPTLGGLGLHSSAFLTRLGAVASAAASLGGAASTGGGLLGPNGPAVSASAPPSAPPSAPLPPHAPAQPLPSAPASPPNGLSVLGVLHRGAAAPADPVAAAPPAPAAPLGLGVAPPTGLGFPAFRPPPSSRLALAGLPPLPTVASLGDAAAAPSGGPLDLSAVSGEAVRFVQSAGAAGDAGAGATRPGAPPAAGISAGPLPPLAELAPASVSLSPDQLALVQAKKRRVLTHFDDLQTVYFRTGSLPEFMENLSKFTRNTKLRSLATIRYGDMYNISNIVSSIEFDKDDELFACAGVLKKIKIYEYRRVLTELPELVYPIREITINSKISCLAWNAYVRTQLACTDYNGAVSLFDVSTGQTVMTLEEHEKRAWSVDFSRTDPTRLVSGSDDCKVKLWSTNQPTSTATIESRANICSVKFNPASQRIAFGSADHHVHYYDLRRLRDPLCVFRGHRKAVSHVKFLNAEEMVSASTDSTLKLWNVTGFTEPVRTYHGHANEKNFVGLAADNEYIACGSELNSVFVYYKSLSRFVLTYRFPPPPGAEHEDDSMQFVSAVSWRRNTNTLLAANSQGVIRVLELS